MTQSSPKKIALVVQRCGKNIVAGAEIYTYELAKALHKYAPEYDVDIFTSKSDNYIRWNNNLPLEEKVSNHVRIFRYPIVHTRLFLLFRVIKRISIFLNRFFYPIYSSCANFLDYLFLRTQGPWCPLLWQDLVKKHNDYSLVIVKSYLYIPNVKAVTELAGNARVLFIVTAHNEPEFRFQFVERALEKASALGFVSLAERDLCSKIWPQSVQKPYMILPPGLESLPKETTDSYKLEDQRHEIRSLCKKKFFLCLGRIDNNKNTPFLFHNTPDGLLVVFAGEKHLSIPNDNRFLYVGKVSDAEKYLLLKHSLALLMVSRFEAYSIVTAEALALGCFVLALKGCLPVDELIQRYGGLSVCKEFFLLTMSYLHEGTCTKSQFPVQSELILKEKSWKANVEKICALIRAAPLPNA